MKPIQIILPTVTATALTLISSCAPVTTSANEPQTTAHKQAQTITVSASKKSPTEPKKSVFVIATRSQDTLLVNAEQAHYNNQ